ncbi:hypothetical protein IAQ61_005383 [Plenodomus lingam]|uniref:25S rRNA (Uridine(2843)-N(3))-methyltransferase n=1 Tax=Leptosphaeria maculans (strain JN3 / isolate v23.1.3 / race Av1-4-5-6-7-8) TaxID=985895 RepID=E4ZZF9_LEPMJ|nr:hypothetical protein LEMA_P110190.1 [Plenodomus lingam JN3]KAH9871204.1 hypothetical protein IAQ61_005383 [Plenodomus lingam]CBX96754.1 hypothetical protein LEMA_P110190.1 [Plenodomus lingam JN3]
MAPNSKLNAKRKAAREPLKVKLPKPKEEKPVVASPIPLELQQLLLNIFRSTFAERFETDINPLLQEVKGHLYNRDFATAFGSQRYLEAYAARWSPSRALGYAEVFWDIKEYLRPSDEDSENENSDKSWKVVCLGGGAGAEIVALAGVQKMLSAARDEVKASGEPKINITAIDVADWSTVVKNLAAQLETTPTLSKYASAIAKAANAPLLAPGSLEVTFDKHDVLAPESSDLSSYLKSASLVTLMFTLNELYTASLPLSQKFLLDLTAAMTPGSLLLVVDSPGSYSLLTLNGAEKQYPMQWLLDHTLLKQANGNQKVRGEEEVPRWEKLQEDESKWFRMDEGLKYPIELENMRMQLHLYRRI